MSLVVFLEGSVHISVRYSDKIYHTYAHTVNNNIQNYESYYGC